MSPWFARSAWLWTEPSAPATPAELASFAVRNGVRETWVSVPLTGPTRRAAAVVRELHARGTDAWCLGGDPAWALRPDDAVAWAQRAVASGLFTGVHLDIEPWGLPEWHTDPARLLDGWVRAVREVAAAIDPIPVDVDVAAWVAWRHPEVLTPLLRAADRLTIMAYADRADRILALAEPAVRAAAVRGRPFRVGVDTVRSPHPGETFFEEGRAALARESSAVAAALAEHPTFAGIAVHDLASWRELRT